MTFILGKKLKMSQVWKDDKVVPITSISAGPVVVTQIKTKDKDGYGAVQVGFGTKKPKNIKKPQREQFKNIGNFQYIREFRVTQIPDSKFQIPSVGDTLDISQFQEGDKVKISGLTKGRGFQGVVKRHSFHGGPKTHGQKNRWRAAGSIGATAPQRVMPNKKMAGRMGQERRTLKSVKIIGIDKEKNILIIKGAVPGSKGTLLQIQS